MVVGFKVTGATVLDAVVAIALVFGSRRNKSSGSFRSKNSSLFLKYRFGIATSLVSSWKEFRCSQKFRRLNKNN